MPSDEPWSECPPGELAELQRSLQDQERRIRGRRRILVAAGGMSIAVAGVGIGAFLSRDQTTASMLSCQETVDLLPRYVAGTLNSPPTQNAVEVHLEHCEKCRKHFQAMIY
ncbi:zf-HC2 domain-containing protein [Bremerella sp.]|uniref:zf-HC2 domain-containing protein n=1 Tax=Bremerella sp. TaxID=2795602 RepID=UPI00391CE388